MDYALIKPFGGLTMEQIILFLDKVKLARKQSYLNMDLFPLLVSGGEAPDYLTLDGALEQGILEVTEIDVGGSVPELKLVNSGRKGLLIIEGEELVGARQNRVVNSTFLVPGKTEVVIPVSCVEQGRWNYQSRSFRSGEKVMHASLRRESQHDVKTSLDQGRGYRSDQGKIWDDIDKKAYRLKSRSATGAMADMFEDHKNHLADYEKAFRLVECQVGAVFAINGRIIGLEVFGYYSTFTEFFGKLIKSYALDAIDWRDENNAAKVPPDRIRRFLGSVTKAKGEEHVSIGLGSNLRFDGRSVSGSALVENARVLHLSAFQKRTNTLARSVAGVSQTDSNGPYGSLS